MGEQQAFIFVNAGAGERIDDEAPTFLARIQLHYKEPRPDGLPTREEYEPVKTVEEKLEEVAKNASDWYVGRVTVSGSRYFFIYTSKTEEEWRAQLRDLSEETGYVLELFYRQDTSHRGYWDELYPTDDDWQVIKDLQVLEALEAHGDDGSAKRQVDHWVYFPNRIAAADFLIWAENNAFSEASELSGETEDGRYCVRLIHHGTVELGDISRHTIALRRKAAESGGEYDGWEVPVVKPAD